MGYFSFLFSKMFWSRTKLVPSHITRNTLIYIYIHTYIILENISFLQGIAGEELCEESPKKSNRCPTDDSIKEIQPANVIKCMYTYIYIKQYFQFLLYVSNAYIYLYVYISNIFSISFYMYAIHTHIYIYDEMPVQLK